MPDDAPRTVGRTRPDPIAYAPRGMSREEAARYVGVGPTKFDELVKEGQMPRPKKMGTRSVWDRFALDASFTEIDAEGGNAIDELLQRQGRRR